MALTITDRVMRSPDTKHTAHRQLSASWTVTWLPDRALTRDQAITAMTIAEEVGRIPADAGPEAYDAKFWALVDSLGGRTRPVRAGRGSTGFEPPASACYPGPAELPDVRTGASDVTWTGADEPDGHHPQTLASSPCGTEWVTDLRPKP